MSTNSPDMGFQLFFTHNNFNGSITTTLSMNEIEPELQSESESGIETEILPITFFETLSSMLGTASPFRFEDIINSIEAEIMNETFEMQTKTKNQGVTQETINKTLGSYQKYKPDMEWETNCSICLESYQPTKYVRKLPCNHKYHKVCIDKWFKSSSFSCPVCRKDFNVEEEKENCDNSDPN